MLAYLFKLLFGPPQLAARSPKWRGVRAQHLLREPVCQACGTTNGLEVHHKRPVHVDASLELNPDNLVTLCETNGCHFLFGHCRDWRSFNGQVESDLAYIRSMLKRRRYA